MDYEIDTSIYNTNFPENVNKFLDGCHPEVQDLNWVLFNDEMLYSEDNQTSYHCIYAHITNNKLDMPLHFGSTRYVFNYSCEIDDLGIFTLEHLQKHHKKYNNIVAVAVSSKPAVDF